MLGGNVLLRVKSLKKSGKLEKILAGMALITHEIKEEKRMRDKWIKTIVAIALLLLALTLSHQQVRAQGPWEVGADVGFLADTVNDEVFTLNFQADYYVDSSISVGPQVIFTPGGDLTQVTFAGVGRYHIPLGAVSIVPFGGIGFVYADYDSGRRDDDDISYTFPIGTSANFHISQSVSLASTLLMTFQDIDLNNSSGSDNFNIGLFFGFRYQP